MPYKSLLPKSILLKSSRNIGIILKKQPNLSYFPDLAPCHFFLYWKTQEVLIVLVTSPNKHLAQTLVGTSETLCRDAFHKYIERLKLNKLFQKGENTLRDILFISLFWSIFLKSISRNTWHIKQPSYMISCKVSF